MYKALIDIGEFKKGDEVPKEKAEVWAKMFKVSPVEEVSGKESKPEPKKVEEAKEESNPMLEDYLGRNESVVVKNIKKDKLSKKVLEGLLTLEEAVKKRKAVISAIKKKLEVVK